MIKYFIKKLMAPRHVWRPDALAYAKAASSRLKLPKIPRIPNEFDELSELYASQLMRSFALGLINIFVPVFLYKLGYDIPTIFWFFVWWFAFRPFLDIITGLIIGRFGPKHTLALGVVMQVVHLVLLLTLRQYQWPLWIVAAIGGWAYGLFILAFEVVFSKVKHAKHGGKELGFVTIFERLGAVLGPLTGGLIANLFGLRYTIGLAIIVLIGSLVPIFMSKEPTKIRQKLHFEQFSFRAHKRDIVSNAMLMLESSIVLIIWPLFIGVTIFTENTYLQLGFVTALGTLGAVLAAQYIGREADKGRGRMLLRTASVSEALLHLLRPFASSFTHVAGINVLNEPINSAFRIPYVKGLFDRADSLPGQRIVYLSMLSVCNTAVRFVFWVALWFAAQFIDPILLMKAAFIMASLFSLGIMLERFPGLDKNQA